MINSDPNYCSVVLVNRGVTVSEDSSSAEVEVQLYGPATQLSCILDGEEAFSCKSMFCNHILCTVVILYVDFTSLSSYLLQL